MAEYKVIALSVGSGKGKIFSSGDIVTEADFEEGEIEEYLESKHLAKVEKGEKKKEEDKPKNQASK